ncbi:MAG: RNA polymerase sigma factor, partial [Anaerolineales bacterium]
MVASSLAGDLNAYNQLVLAYQDMAYNTAYRILGEKTSAEDVVQDAFLSAYRKLNSFHGGSYKAWLLRIVVNRCYDEIRRR